MSLRLDARRATRASARAWVLLVVGVAMGVAACGGGSTERLSRDAMTKRADAICTAGLRASNRLREKAVIGAHGEAAAAEIDASIDVLEEQIDELADLRGPASTDRDLSRAVEQLRKSTDGLADLSAAAARDDLTVDEAIRENPDVVKRVNAATAKSWDHLGSLGFFKCIGLAT